MTAPTPPRWPVDVSIVIPVFNKAELTATCLDSLVATTRGVSHEVIVVDNASTDATPRLLAARPAVRGIRNEANRGFSAACNQGAAAARGHHLLFLNNDTVPLEGWLERLVREFRQRPEVAVVGARLLYASGLVQHAGVAFARETRSPFHPYRGLLGDDPRVNRRREVQAVTAACMLIRREWFEREGGFSEEFRNGYEDLDLCLNIRRQGGLIVYQPGSAVVHLESQTPGRMKFDDANRTLFFTKWVHWLLADEDAYYLSDGYKVIYRQEHGRSAGRLVGITDEADRRAWQVVADVQRLAAQGQWSEAAARLEDVEPWPADAAVRRWAAAVCFRQGHRVAGLEHLRRSLELEPSPDALLHLARTDPSVTVPPRLDGSADAGTIDADSTTAAHRVADASVRSHAKAIRAFAAERFNEAGKAFEEALVLGASPREALFGMAAAAKAANDTATARQCCDAMLARDPEDPLARSLLRRPDRGDNAAGPCPGDSPRSAPTPLALTANARRGPRQPDLR